MCIVQHTYSTVYSTVQGLKLYTDVGIRFLSFARDFGTCVLVVLTKGNCTLSIQLISSPSPSPPDGGERATFLPCQLKASVQYKSKKIKKMRETRKNVEYFLAAATATIALALLCPTITVQYCTCTATVSY